MAMKIIDEKDLPSADMAEIEFAKNAQDSQIDTSEIPELELSQLKELAAIARKKREPMPTVALRLPESVLERYKALGDGYADIMADILANALSYF